MKKIILALFALASVLFLSGCVSTYSSGYSTTYYPRYSSVYYYPGYNTTYVYGTGLGYSTIGFGGIYSRGWYGSRYGYYGRGWYGNRAWNRGWYGRGWRR